MPTVKANLSDYEFDDQSISTPALAIYVDAVEHNIERAKVLIGAERWRPHLKTSKLLYTQRKLVEHGVVQAKCATTLELLTACQAGMKDVVVAYPLPANAASRVAEIAVQFPDVSVSSIVESEAQLEFWRGSKIGLFIDVNPGMNRTGIEVETMGEIVELAKKIQSIGLPFRGIHYYDGHSSQADLNERIKIAHAGYEKLLQLIEKIQNAGIDVGEVITAGTPALPCALAYEPFRTGSFRHRVSPGTIVYNDTTSLAQLPESYGFRPAAVVVSSIVSHPRAGLITCDAGHKTVSADAGIPNCEVIGNSEWTPQKPSEEHLPIEVPGEGARLGERVYLIPKHVCPTVNNFDHALIIERGRIVAVESVTARGREVPLRRTVAMTR